MRILRVCALSLSLIWCVGCSDRVVVPDGDGPSRCQQRPDQETQLQVGIEAGFQQGLIKFEGQAGYDQLLSVKNNFDRLQADFAQMSYQLCEDSANKAISRQYYERRRECLDRAMIAMRAMSTALDADDKDPQQLAWEAESKMAWLGKVLECPKEGAPTLEAKAETQPEVSLTTYLLCQRREQGRFVDVPACTKTPLAENDKVRFGFKVSEPAYIYVLNHNDTGLFQMLFPDKGVPNKVIAEKDYIFPPDSWLELDDQSGVIEHLQVIASVEPIPELEAQRGVYIEPGKGASKRPSKQAIKTRGVIEPLLTRGFKQKSKPVMLDVGDASPVSTIPMVSKRKGVVVNEFEIIHK